MSDTAIRLQPDIKFGHITAKPVEPANKPESVQINDAKSLTDGQVKRYDPTQYCELSDWKLIRIFQEILTMLMQFIGVSGYDSGMNLRLYNALFQTHKIPSGGGGAFADIQKNLAQAKLQSLSINQYEALKFLTEFCENEKHLPKAVKERLRNTTRWAKNMNTIFDMEQIITNRPKLIQMSKAVDKKKSPLKHLAKPLLRTNSLTADTIRLKAEQEKILTQTVQDIQKTIQNLPSGETTTISTAIGGGKNHLLLNVTKTGSSYTLMITSRDPHIQNAAVIAAAGKHKMLPSVPYVGVLENEFCTQNWLKPFLMLAAPASSKNIKDSLNPKSQSGSSKIALLELFRPLESKQDLSAQPQVFKTARDQINPISNLWAMTHGGPIMKTRLLLWAHYGFFSNSRMHLQGNYMLCKAFAKGNLQLRRELIHLKEKNLIGKTEVAQITKELDRIEKDISKALNPKAPPPPIAMPTGYDLTLDFKGTLTKPVKPLLQPVKDIPCIKPPAEHTYDPTRDIQRPQLALPPIDKNNPLPAIEKAHQRIVDYIAKVQPIEAQEYFMQFIDSLPLETLKEFDLSKSPWHKLSAEQLKQASQLLFEMSQKVTQQVRLTQTILPDRFFALTKAAYIIDLLAHLNCKNTGYKWSYEIFAFERLTNFLETDPEVIPRLASPFLHLREKAFIDKAKKLRYRHALVKDRYKVIEAERKEDDSRSPYPITGADYFHQYTYKWVRSLIPGVGRSRQRIGAHPVNLNHSQNQNLKDTLDLFELFLPEYPERYFAIESSQNSGSEMRAALTDTLSNRRRCSMFGRPIQKSGMLGAAANTQIGINSRDPMLEAAIEFDPKAAFEHALEKLPREKSRFELPPHINKEDLISTIKALDPRVAIVETMAILDQTPYLLQIPDVRNAIEMQFLSPKSIVAALKHAPHLSKTLPTYMKKKFDFFYDPKTKKEDYISALFIIHLSRSMEKLFKQYSSKYQLSDESENYIFKFFENLKSSEKLITMLLKSPSCNLSSSNKELLNEFLKEIQTTHKLIDSDIEKLFKEYSSNCQISDESKKCIFKFFENLKSSKNLITLFLKSPSCNVSLLNKELINELLKETQTTYKLIDSDKESISNICHLVLLNKQLNTELLKWAQRARQVDKNTKLYEVRSVILSYWLDELCDAPHISQRDIKEILLFNMQLKRSPILESDTDPVLMDKVQRLFANWTPVFEKAFDDPKFKTAFLDRACEFFGHPIADETWDGTYPKFTCNSYKIDIAKGYITRVGSNRCESPLSQAALSLLRSVCPDQDIRNCHIERIDSKFENEIYQFQDQNGVITQIEIDDKEPRLYKSRDGKQWLQFVPREQLFPKAPGKWYSRFKGATKVLKDQNFKEGIKDLLKPYLHASGIPEMLMGEAQFIDTENSKCLVTFDAFGKPLFKLTFDSKFWDLDYKALGGMRLQKIEDMRPEFAEANKGRTVAIAGTCDAQFLKNIARFEDLNEVLLWGKSGKLQAVELARLGLLFEIKNRTLICKTKKYDGYTLDLNPSIEDTKGIQSAIVLCPPNPKDNKILLVSKSKDLKFDAEEPDYWAQALAFFKAFLTIFKKARFLIDTINKAAILSEFINNLTINLSWSIDRSESKRTVWEFEITRLENEVRPPEKAKPLALVDFMLHAQIAMRESHLAALQSIGEIASNMRTLEHSDFDSLKPEEQIQLMQQIGKISKNAMLATAPEEVGLGLRCLLLLLERMPPRYQMGNNEDSIKGQIGMLFHLYLQQSKHCDVRTRLSDAELKSCFDLYAQLDPESYVQIAPYYLIKDKNIEHKSTVDNTHTFKSLADRAIKVQKLGLGNNADELARMLKFDPNRVNSEYRPYFVNKNNIKKTFASTYAVLSTSDINGDAFKRLDMSLSMVATKEDERSLNGQLIRYLQMLCHYRKSAPSDKLPPLPKLEPTESRYGVYYSNNDAKRKQLQELEKKERLLIQTFFSDLDRRICSYTDPFETEASPLEKDIQSLKQSIGDIQKHVLNEEDTDDPRALSNLSVDQLEKKLKKKEATIIDPTDETTPNPFDSIIDLKVDHALFKKSELSDIFEKKELNASLRDVHLDLSIATKSKEKVVKDKALELSDKVDEADETIKSKEFQGLCGECDADLKKRKIKLQNLLKSKHTAAADAASKAKQKILKALSFSNSDIDMAKYKAGFLNPVTWTELLISFYRNELHLLAAHTSDDQRRLPKETKIKDLEADLIQFFKHSVDAKRTDPNDQRSLYGFLDTMEKEKTLSCTFTCNNLHTMLTQKRMFDDQKDPKLLLTEYYLGFLFRELQLGFVEELQKQPNILKQAATGSGKTAAIMPMLAHVLPNGSNLVTLKFLNPLLQTSLDHLKAVVTQFLRRRVVHIRYDSTVPIEIKQGNNESVSVFELIYKDLVRAILAKDVVVTDLASFIHMDEKLIALCENKTSLSPIEKQHLHFLAKIRLLRQEREQAVLDESDAALDVNHKFLLRTKAISEKPSAHIYESVIKLFDQLKSNDVIGIKGNVQADLLAQTRDQLLTKHAREITEEIKKTYGQNLEEDQVFKYLTGKDASILDTAVLAALDAKNKDDLALKKDLFSSILPTVLSKKGGSGYILHNDGVFVVPVEQGSPGKPSARAVFQNPIVRMAYINMWYRQMGVSEKCFEKYTKEITEDAITELAEAYDRRDDSITTLDQTATGKQFWKDFGEKFNTSLSDLSKGSKASMLKSINDPEGDPELIRKFIVYVCKNIEITTDATNASSHSVVASSRFKCGVSATRGCPDGYQRGFDKESEGAKKANLSGLKIAGESLRSLKSRFDPLQKLIVYTPDCKHPENIITDLRKECPKMGILIDGSTDTANANPRTLAKALKGNLKKVTYWDAQGKKQIYIDDNAPKAYKDASLDESGTLYSAAQARGADNPNSTAVDAVLLPNLNGNLEDAYQNLGRLRRQDHQARLAVPSTWEFQIQGSNKIFKVAEIVANEENTERFLRHPSIKPILEQAKIDYPALATEKDAWVLASNVLTTIIINQWTINEALSIAEELYKNDFEGAVDEVREAALRDTAQTVEQESDPNIGGDAILQFYTQTFKHQEHNPLVNKTQKAYSAEGEYFKAFSAISSLEKPAEVLKDNKKKQKKMIKACLEANPDTTKTRELIKARKRLKGLNYIKKAEKYPEFVYKANASDQTATTETEMTVEAEQTVDVNIAATRPNTAPSFPPWENPENTAKGSFSIYHPAYSKNLFYTHNYFSTSKGDNRDKKQAGERTPHDHLQKPLNFVLVARNPSSGELSYTALDENDYLYYSEGFKTDTFEYHDKSSGHHIWHSSRTHEYYGDIFRKGGFIVDLRGLDEDENTRKQCVRLLYGKPKNGDLQKAERGLVQLMVESGKVSGFTTPLKDATLQEAALTQEGALKKWLEDLSYGALTSFEHYLKNEVYQFKDRSRARYSGSQLERIILECKMQKTGGSISAVGA